MNAEEFFRMIKDKRKMENEYFIAMEKNSFFTMMESYAELKLKEHNINTSPQVFKTEYKPYVVVENN